MSKMRWIPEVFNALSLLARQRVVAAQGRMVLNYQNQWGERVAVHSVSSMWVNITYGAHGKIEDIHGHNDTDFIVQKLDVTI